MHQYTRNSWKLVQSGPKNLLTFQDFLLHLSFGTLWRYIHGYLAQHTTGPVNRPSELFFFGPRPVLNTC